MIDIDSFSSARVLIVGDIMLDQYWWGNVTRISPEAPVPVVNLERTSVSVGGAANVAANIAGLGAKAFLIGTVGADDEGRMFPRMLKHLGVTDHLIEIDSKPTSTKTRIVAHSQHVVRVDRETNNDISTFEEDKIFSAYESLIDKIDVVVLSDYAKGLLTESLLKRLIDSAREHSKAVLVDPKGKNFSKYRGATLITPNKREAADACALEESSKNLVDNAGKSLLSHLGLSAVLITQGENGMTLFQQAQEPYHMNARARHVYDVTGAGDTVIATLAVGIASGHTMKMSAELANLAAGFVVEEVGTSIISLDTLTKGIELLK
jgi:D-beta-D-heptose 7-phosphate kinase/D-beta-D-heptose 1-phosphate adenosyltransferase